MSSQTVHKELNGQRKSLSYTYQELGARGFNKRGMSWISLIFMWKLFQTHADISRKEMVRVQEEHIYDNYAIAKMRKRKSNILSRTARCHYNGLSTGCSGYVVFSEDWKPSGGVTSPVLGPPRGFQMMPDARPQQCSANV